MDELEDEYAIGLDLGTTFSCIGVYRNGGVEIIPNRNGEKTTPSIVIIAKDGNILVGEETTDFLVKNYDSCIYEVKRLIGREFNDKKLQEEIKKLPFKIVQSNRGKTPEVEIIINGQKRTFSPVEISSFIIKHMVKNAEKYLDKKITKLIITVPAYFNNSQRELTKQAAELIGLKVLRVINEPTAAALSYGFDKKQNINENILIFDLGGGTFDVSILSFKKDNNMNSNYTSFEVKGISGDTNLGGEDFDNELVDFILKKVKLDEKEIYNDKEAIKKLKVSCENIKKILSSSEETTIRINNFYNNIDINEKITRKEFEDKCEHLFNKLEISLKDALKNAKLGKDNIQEIILVGGSTRIPKVKEIIKNYFPKSKINDTINPDEAVAFGATIDAEKILHNKDDSISNFHLLDVTPLSLGTNIKNNSKDEKTRKEGDEMSIIIKRGTHIPTFNSCKYYNVADNQKAMSINVYEGEKKYVKYNHLIKESEISGLTPREKGKTKVIVTFEIDLNGILTVKAKEVSGDGKGQELELTIKNDDISFTKKELDELKRKNDEMFEKMKNNNLSSKIDYTNLKETLKKYQDAYNKYNETKKKTKNNNEDDDDEDPRIIYKTNFNSTLEEFIDKFEKNFDNETVLEKFYLYVKELFLSYIETLKLGIDRGEQNHIMDKIKEYIEIFVNKSSGYLNNLLEILQSLGNEKKNKFKIFFYVINIFVIEKLNKEGKECIRSNKKFCKYHSLMYFEQAEKYYKKYLANIDEALLKEDQIKSLKDQKVIFTNYINNIKCGAIVLCEDSFKAGRLINEDIISKGTGKTNDLLKYAFGNKENNIEALKIVLSNYESALSSIQVSNKPSKTEAICIANIIKLNSFLGHVETNNRTLFHLAQRCLLITEQENINKEEEWYKDFMELYDFLKKLLPPEDDYNQKFKKIKEKHGDIFEEIDKQFNEKKSEKDFITFILKKHPYQNYEKDKDKRDFSTYNAELIRFLLEKYQPDNYSSKTTYSDSDNDSGNNLEFYIYHEISSKLSNLFYNIQ